jgi:hypothetical protein
MYTEQRVNEESKMDRATAIKQRTKQRLRDAGESVAGVLFEQAKRLPFLKDRISSEYDKVMSELRRAAKPYRDELPSITRLPERGRSRDEILGQMRELQARESTRWREGFVSAIPSTPSCSSKPMRSARRPIRCTRTCGRASPNTRRRLSR